MSVLQVLFKHIENYDKIPIKGSGIALKDLKNLQSLDMISFSKIPLKSGNMPTKDNAFEITLFGRETARRSMNKKVKKSEIVVLVSKQIEIIGKDISNLTNQLTEISSRLQHIESIIPDQEESRAMNKRELTNNELIDLLKRAEIEAKREDKMGVNIKTEIYFAKIAMFTPYSNESINKMLYQLFEQNILDLQMGPDHGGRVVLSPSGKRFAWGKLVN